MISLQIQSLLGANINVPYVDRLKDGKTPFNYPIQNFIGGVNGKDIATVVPALVGIAEGTNIFVAAFTPNNDAYASLASNPNEFEAQVRQVIFPNPLSGPGLEPAAIDLDFIKATAPNYMAKTFHALANQPQTLTSGLCQ